MLCCSWLIVVLPLVVLNRNDLLSMKAAMEEEHRKDREALERLLRYLPTATTNGLPANGAARADTPREAPRKRTAQLPLLDPAGLKPTIEKIMQTHPDKDWSSGSLLVELEKLGAKPKAIRPEASVGQAIRALLEEEKIILSKKGSGRIPHQYRWVDNTGSANDITT